MKEFLLSDDTKVKIENHSGIIEQIMGTKRVEIRLTNENGIIKLLVYKRDIEKILKIIEEV